MTTQASGACELERLEARLLLAADLLVNFQPVFVTVPAGYLVDAGAA